MNPKHYKKEVGGSQARQIHRPFRRNFVAKREFRKIVAKYPYHGVSIDLADFNRVKTHNKGFRYVFIIIDTYSRYVWAYPVKNKQQKVLAEIFEGWLRSQKFKVENVNSDREFDNNRFHDLAQTYGFVQWFGDILRTGNVAQGEKFRTGLVERFVRNLRRRIAIYSTENQTKTFVPALPQIIKEYNNTKHSAHLKTPHQVITGAANPEFEHQRFVKDIRMGAIVRRLLARRKFAKESEPFWSSELYRIVGRDRNRYIIENVETARREPRPYAVHQLMPVTSRPKKQAPPVTSRKRGSTPRNITSKKVPPPVTSRNNGSPRRSNRKRKSKYASLAGMA